MKIALISAINNPIKAPFEGGVEACLWWIAKKLIDRGHEVSLFASKDSDLNLPITPIAETSLFVKDAFKHADGQGFINKINRKIRFRASTKIYRKLRTSLAEEGHFDIIHNHALFETPLLDAETYSAPMVTTLHTPPFREIAKGVKIAGHYKSSYFVSVSNSLAQVWKDYVSSDVIYNGINIDDWTYQEASKSKTAIWFGRITPQKAPHLAIEAALKAGYELNLYGRIVDQAYYEAEVLPLISSSAEVNYGGSLSHAELSEKIGEASVMINTPKWEEPFGLTFVEAMACGTPIATFESGAASEVLTEKTGIIVPKNDVRALSDSLDKVASLNRSDCRVHVINNFSLDKMINEYEALYKKVISSE